ncbi:probable ubiquitin-like-specific protease 2B [Dendrobium catenatum]|nr:probable ubiquitin-like-specific protease 2B [Dendrobium catenatum]
MYGYPLNVLLDVEKFIASVADVCWLDKEKKIKSLAERYKDIWNTVPDNNYALEDDMLTTHMSFSKRYFSDIMEPFEDVIYPKGDPDAVSISKRDIELLEPDTFINDTIIDFYIKYLQNKVQPIEKKRFHFFNSFFFRKLADLDKDPGSISEGRAAFQRVRKWTRKLNIFEKDYIFIPVNFNLHWSLLVICHPGEIITFRDDDLKSSPKVPCILHMDSIIGSHSGLKDLIQSYLLEEWKERHPELTDDITPRFSNLRFVSLELPQQENSFDCGLFLLHYVELFLEEAPVYFNPSRITVLSNFLSADWFPPAEASFKRFHIRGLLYELLRDSSQKLTPTCSNGDFPCSGDDVDQGVEFLSAEDSPSKLVNGSASTPLCATPDDNFEHTASFESTPTTCIMEELGDAKVSTTEHLLGEGNEESSDNLVGVIKDQNGCQPHVGSPTSQICSASYCVNNVGSSELPSISDQVQEEIVDNLSTRSNGQLVISNETDVDVPQKLAPVVDDGAFVPDSPNTSNENLKEYLKNSLEIDDCNLEVKSHDEECDNDEKFLETYTNDTETRHEEECENPDTSLTENGKAEHFLEKKRRAEEVSDDQENHIVNEISNEAIKDDPHFHDSEMVEVISLDNDVIQPKRSKISGSVQQSSKRRKVVHQGIVRRITRSSSKECAS